MEFEDSDRTLKVTLKQTANTRTITVVQAPLPTHILDDFIRKMAMIREGGYADPLSLGLFGKTHPFKEMMESGCALHYVLKFLHSTCRSRESYLEAIRDPHTLCMCVGDGRLPQSAYLFATTTNWQVLAIDPALEEEWVEDTTVPSLKCLAKLVEDVDIDFKLYSRVIIVAVHSHADLDALWQRIAVNIEKIALSVPCCQGFVQHVAGVPPVHHFREVEMQTEKNEVFMWHSSPPLP
jgi:hypothetical protein